MVDDEKVMKKKRQESRHMKNGPKHIKNNKESSKKEKTKKENKTKKEEVVQKVKKNSKENDIIKKEKLSIKNKKVPKEMSQEILKRIFRYLIGAVLIILYFIILNLAYTNMNQERLIKDIETFASVFLLFGIFFLEKAYKKDSGYYAITGIEFLVLSLHSLSIMHIITLLNYDFRLYLLASSYVFASYYVLKSMIIYTKERRDYLYSLSDIPDIVKKDKPIKKEAKKRNVNKLEENEDKLAKNKKVKTKRMNKKV